MPPEGYTARYRNNVSPRSVWTGSFCPSQSTDGTNKAGSSTKTYTAEVFVPAPMRITGIALFNGAAVTGNVQAFLSDVNGTVVASSASTAQSGTDALQALALSTAYDAQPGTYYVSIQTSGAGEFNTLIIGTCGTSETTGTTYGTLTSITPPTTFTTGLGPIASLY